MAEIDGAIGRASVRGPGGDGLGAVAWDVIRRAARSNA
jgi:hypothetical protein